MPASGGACRSPRIGYKQTRTNQTKRGPQIQVLPARPVDFRAETDERIERSAGRVALRAHMCFHLIRLTVTTD